LQVDIIETSFIVNLGILALATCFVKFAEVPVSQVALVYSSAGVALSPSAELFSTTLTNKSGYSHFSLIFLVLSNLIQTYRFFVTPYITFIKL